MKHLTRFRAGSVVAFFAVLLTASAAFGAVGSMAETTDDASGDDVIAACEPTETPPPEGTSDEGTTDETEDCDEQDGRDEGPVDEGGDDVDDPADGTTSAGEPTPEERQVACEGAAGLTPEEPASDVEGEKTKGLDHAIERVWENCLRNPQAPGLVTALERLVWNRDHRQAHEEAKAAAKAEREAAKAERAAAKAALKASGEHGKGSAAGLGNAGGHGNGHAGGHGNGS